MRVGYMLKMAEGVGFEPTGRVNAQRFSRACPVKIYLASTVSRVPQ